MSRSNPRPETKTSKEARPASPKAEARDDDPPLRRRAEAKQHISLASDFWAAQSAFQRGEYATAVELTRGMNDRIAEATMVRRQSVPESPSAAIVVVSYRHTPAVPLSLQAIRDQIDGLGAEIVFVDNGNESLLGLVEENFDSFTYLRPPFNVGCSAGRNVGVRYTSADIVVFIDDDGIIEPGCIEALLNRMRTSGAATCRGRVRPLNSSVTPRHYDYGPNCVPSIPNAECASAWRRELFDDFDGFDVLLAGHEGMKLCADSYRFFGPLGYLYEPLAVIRHDYADNEQDATAKAERHVRLERYLNFRGVDPKKFRALFASTRDNLRERYLVGRWESTPQPKVPSEGRARVSVITTAKNAANFINDYTRGWKSQSCSDFEILFVDDGSTDDTVKRIRAAWRDDPRLRLIETPGIGRSAALNLALANCRTDLCMIGDVDDISRHDRTSWTLDALANNPNLDCISFHTFDEKFAFFGGRPNWPFATDVTFRQLFGTPVSFRTFAFRKSSFLLPFDTKLKAAVDFDWLTRNFQERSINGRVVPVPLAYRRVHEAQISSTHKKAQETTAMNIIYQNFSKVLGPIDDEDKANIAKLIERVPVTGRDDMRSLFDWLMAFLAENRRKRIYEPDRLDEYFLSNFLQMRIGLDGKLNQRSTQHLSFKDQFEKATDLYLAGNFRHAARHFLLAADRDPTSDAALRAAAEAYIANRNRRMARRVLRKALKLKPDDAQIRRRIFATRWPFRALRDMIAAPYQVN